MGGYFGERIDIAEVLVAIADLARADGWEQQEISAGSGIELMILRRRVRSAARRIYLSAGIHGDEPAGPLAIQRLLADRAWPPDADVWLCPCLNPRGFATSTRTNADGIDLNRDYRDARSPEVRAHIEWLREQPSFDFALCLHEDWEAHGFYVYEINPDDRESLARRIIEAVRHQYPIDSSPEIDGWPADGGVIVPTIDPGQRPLWPEALYLFANHTRHTCTLEAPSDFPLPMRTAALVAGVKAALE